MINYINPKLKLYYLVGRKLFYGLIGWIRPWWVVTAQLRGSAVSLHYQPLSDPQQSSSPSFRILK
jgi:hypothetical protein